jgi:bifunctional non-homologous end joining protein LigD
MYLRCSGALPLPLAVPKASSSRACQRLAIRSRSARNGHTRSNTTASASSAAAKAIACGCSPGAASTDRVPTIANALAALRVKSVTLDGEGVVCREDGVSDFDRLRTAVGRLGSRDAFLYAFDLLEINGTDLRRDAWHVRRSTLASLLRRAGHGIQLSDHLDGADGGAVFGHACKLGLEGIVAKRRDRPYRSGRSPDWIKVKNPDAPAATRILEW